MPVTKTAKRALRSSKRKEEVNKRVVSNLEAAIRAAKKSKNKKNILKAISLADRAVKRNIIHINKAARLKSSLSKLLPRRSKGSSGSTAKKKRVKSKKSTSKK